MGENWQRSSCAMTKDEFKADVAAWAKRIGVQPAEVHVRDMAKKWGSCSTLGRVTFNRELLAAPADLRREVIVEELLHLRVPNHGKLFRVLKKAYLRVAALEPAPSPRATARASVLYKKRGTKAPG